MCKKRSLNKSHYAKSRDGSTRSQTPKHVIQTQHWLHTFTQPYISEFDTICRRDLPLWCIAGKITARIKCFHHKYQPSLACAKVDRKYITIRTYWLQIFWDSCAGTDMCVMRNWHLRNGDKAEISNGRGAIRKFSHYSLGWLFPKFTIARFCCRDCLWQIKARADML